MNINGQFKAVTETDLYNFYGITSLDLNQLDNEERKIVEFTLSFLKKTYMEALRTRFAAWSPNGGKVLTVEDMIKILKDSLNDAITEQAPKMAAIGSGFNVMAAIKQLRGETEESKKKAEEQHISQFADKLSQFDKDKYPKIAKGVIKLHEAHSMKDIILAIDYLNMLQHWGGMILIDLIAGHRDPSDPEGNRVLQNILEVKKQAKSPLEFSDKMSPDVRKIVSDQQRFRHAGIIK